MTAFYCDISAVGNEYQAYAPTPTWGALATNKPLPMDGNGLAGPGHSAAVSIAEIDVTSASVAATNTLVIAGATLTAVASGATTNQFNVGSGATLASNLVSAINAATNTVNAGSCAATLGLQYWCFARVKPGASTVVQIATRIAGANLNYANNTNVAITSSGWSVAPGITQFAGGADGPFGYLNSYSLTPFGKAVTLWGCWSTSKTGGPTDPGAAADIIHVRTRRSGSNLGITHTFTAGVSVLTPTSTPRSFLFDDGTTWSGDNGQFQYLMTASSVANATIGPGVTSTLRLAARAKWGLRIVYSSTNAGYYFCFSAQPNSFSVYENVLFEAANNTSTMFGMYPGGNQSISQIGCKWILRYNNYLHYPFDSNTYYSKLSHIDCDFEWIGKGAAVTGVLSIGSGAFTTGLSGIYFEMCRFTVDGGTYSVTSPVGGTYYYGNGVDIRFENCTGLSNASAGMQASTYISSGNFVWDDGDDARQFRIECANYVLDFQVGQNIPTYLATTPTGAAFSHRLAWQTGRLQEMYPINVSRYATFFKDTAGTKTVTLEMLVPTAEIPTQAQVFAVMKYTDSTGVRRMKTSAQSYVLHAAGLGTALVDGVGTGSWTLNGTTGVSSKKIAITTDYAVKQNSEIVVDLFLRGSPSSNYSIYINPEPIIS